MLLFTNNTVTGLPRASITKPKLSNALCMGGAVSTYSALKSLPSTNLSMNLFPLHAPEFRLIFITSRSFVNHSGFNFPPLGAFLCRERSVTVPRTNAVRPYDAQLFIAGEDLLNPFIKYLNREAFFTDILV